MKHNTILKLGASLLVALGFSTAANAAFISGTINFGTGANGGITLQDVGGNSTTSLTAAAGVTSWTNAIVTTASGDYCCVPNGTLVSLASPWIFNPSTSYSPFWTITRPDLSVITFDLTGSVITFQTSGGLIVEGTGMAQMPGFTDTPGTWFFSTQGSPSNGLFSWSSTTDVPDGGTTLALLGGSLLGLGAIRRKLVKA